MNSTAAIRRRVTTLGTIAAGALMLSSLGIAEAVEQNVSWTRPVNVAIRGGALEKTGGCDGCDDAGALSQQVIRGNNGYVEFRVPDPYKFWIAGLTRSDGNPRFNEIDFGIRFNGNGWADVLEDGAYQANSDTESNAGDVFQVAVVGSRVRYIKNGAVFFESSRTPSFPLVFATALGSLGTRVANARIESRGAGLAADLYDPIDPYDQYDMYDFRLFTTLDRNGNGVVTRGEWRGTTREFNRLDLNADNRLTRREVVGRAEAAVGVGTSGNQVIVDPRERWTYTGIRVRAGDTLSFEADGTIQMSDNSGDIASPAGSSRQAVDAPMPSRSAGILIARIGNSPPIAIGGQRTFTAPVGGEVLLSVNDDHLPDNTGEFRVSIVVNPR